MESIKHEVLNTKSIYAEEFNYLGMFSLINLQFSMRFEFFQFFFFNDVTINRNEVQRISRCGSELPCSSERKQKIV